MGNQQTVSVKPNKPQQFVSQAHMDWVKQMESVYLKRPTLTKTVMLPPGVDLGDPRLTQGVVVAERTYTLPSGQFPEWPENSPFECDVDGRLLPPCWGERHMHAHYAVYPNAYFPELNCAYCNLHRAMSPEEGGEKLSGDVARHYVAQHKQSLEVSEGKGAVEGTSIDDATERPDETTESKTLGIDLRHGTETPSEEQPISGSESPLVVGMP